MQDVGVLIAYLNRMVDAGRTLVVIEHNLDVIAAADRVVELGAKGGSEGGRVVFESTPDALIQAVTPTGSYLERALA